MDQRVMNMQVDQVDEGRWRVTSTDVPGFTHEFLAATSGEAMKQADLILRQMAAQRQGGR